MLSFAFCKCFVFAISLVMIPEALAQGGSKQPKLGPATPNCAAGLTTICVANLGDKISATTHSGTVSGPRKNVTACPFNLRKACCKKAFGKEAAKKGIQKTTYGQFCAELAPPSDGEK
ncbi:hypothetical protein MJO28_001609 [Puccinia striiformis f. sp. tritici]|uniref:Uncharacterized protein n=3 Tax=Puccinia striiformis TaxID=27350 RepID=A0A0L0W4Y9_9BASI|nr:hypothetical protein Pst134EB_004203 [Puccinia striiformis f. sp. tritici]KAI9626158.1 hypothetical protein H4Q26_015907 [Puccinia striiformis f. sp. tritici PST-130]KNF06579.1 hypothetical protein PSTG_00452 [Puccinia striiformis f. sp. tritici PST-78]POW19255.1 hypothetical protein PSHT_04864 [Puccinia striiformis]KAI7961120.1 hypothetical protein MJO28_001609 [Puccinia striiformis f. sp. tritici]